MGSALMASMVMDDVTTVAHVVDGDDVCSRCIMDLDGYVRGAEDKARGLTSCASPRG
jgi:hypothetical protein